MRIAVIGAGAAGMMAAARIQESRPEFQVFLVEKNPGLGHKVIISGGGRCNVTTGQEDMRVILDCYPRGSRFLTSALHRFPPVAVRAWFESRGVPLKCEKDLRIFPKSNDGKDVVRVFERLFKQNGARLLLKHEVQGIQKNEDGSFTLNFKGHPAIEVDKVLLTTGGQAHRHTGSTGDGYAFAEGLGHSVTPLAPSLNSFITQETWLKAVAGVSLPKVTLKTKLGKAMQFTGPIVFTHRGLSGPAVFALSALVAFENYTAQNPLYLSVDLFPDTPASILEQEWLKAVAEHPKKQLGNLLDQFLPQSLAEALPGALSIDGTKRVNELSKKDQHKLLDALKNLALHVVARGAGDEFVTAGGVDLNEVNPRTMESLICPGLYFAGELLNIDGFTGGFNLQASWATGALAGEHLASL